MANTDPATYTGRDTTTVAATANSLTNAILGGSRWGVAAAGAAATLTYAFPDSVARFDSAAGVAGNYAAVDPLGYGFGAYLPGFSGFDAPAREAARAVLAAWSEVAQLSFAEVPADGVGAGTLRFAYTTPSGIGATTYGVSAFPQDLAVSGDTWINSGFLYPEGWAAGGQNFLTLLHEVGHALGLKHPHDTGLAGALPGWPQNTATLEKTGEDTLVGYSTQDMVMAYNDLPGVGSPVQADYAPTTPMRVDIAAMQYLYGANNSTRADDTVYTFDGESRYNQTIWDGGGRDTIVATGTRDVAINLNPGTWSRLGLPLTYSERNPDLTVARARPDLTRAETVYLYDTVTIENATGGNGNDTLIGNAHANRLQGNAGDDLIDGGDGVDLAAYAGTRDQYTVARTPDNWRVSATGTAGDGQDTLTAVERLQFADISLALDTGTSGHAGQTAQILRALFGSTYVDNTVFAGIGLSLLDQGTGYEALVALAIGTPVFEQLAGGRGNRAFVEFVYRNVVGTAADEASAASFTSLLDTGAYTQATLGVLACQTALNAQSAQLVGLVETGLPYLAPAGT